MALFTHNSVTILLSITVMYLTWLITRRLMLSPISHIPGPRLAALTFWYEFYYDVWRKGQYTFKIRELHEQYGPVIRINPYEVHVNDPDMYDQIYVGPSARKTDKWWWSANMFQVPTSTLSTIPHALHRRRRAMFGSYFSPNNIHKLEPFLKTKIDRFIQRLQEFREQGRPVNLAYAFSALTIDIITVYCFGEPYGYLDHGEFAKSFHDSTAKLSLFSHATKQLPNLFLLLSYLPNSVNAWIFPDQSELQRMQLIFRSHANKALEDSKSGISAVKEDSAFDTIIPKSMFESMIEADVPPSEKSLERLSHEAQLFVIAGTLTTAHTLMTITYHLLANPLILARLRQELLAASISTSSSTSDSPSYRQHIPLRTLEALPQLNSIIREGLRLGTGVPHRLQRVSPDTSIHIHEYILPPETPISMSAMLMHTDASIFPDPHRFNPDRWLPLETTGKHLNRYLVPFSKGSRQCVGINLAWAELYLTLAAMFGPADVGHEAGLEMTLFETDFDRDVKVVIDGFNPLTSEKSKGLRVMIE